MPDLSMEATIGQLLAVLCEAFEGAERWSYFTDHGADAGLLGTLGKLSAAEASRPTGGTTIAAHAHHVVFSLEASSAWIRGDRSRRNWAESWSVTTVDAAAWARLLEELEKGYRDLRQAIEAHASSSVEAMGGAAGAVAHMAYHLGAIRQKVAFSRQA
ncbi:MAG TPA: hypothetical protein VGG03_11970 [Thermoanaerobaculia bacterium]|jgi:hypothetical protein